MVRIVPKEVNAMMIQHQKDASLPSLLYVTRKLGEVEGMISMQADLVMNDKHFSLPESERIYE